MKLPEMPGSIMVQMARAPQTNKNQRSSGVSVGESVHTASPSSRPKARKTTSTPFQPFISLNMVTLEAMMSPKKKAQVSTG